MPYLIQSKIWSSTNFHIKYEVDIQSNIQYEIAKFGLQKIQT